MSDAGKEREGFGRLLKRAQLAFGVPALLALGTAANAAEAPDAPAAASPAPGAQKAPAQRPLPAVHLERSISADNPEWLGIRHAEAAARITAEAARQQSATGAVDDHVEGDPFAAPTEGLALAMARVVTVSEVGTQPFDMNEACARFDALPGIVVQAAGNDGDRATTAQQAQQSTALQCADLLIRVGAAHDGRQEAYSSRSTPDLLGENPFRQGFAYAVNRNLGDIRARMAEVTPQLREEVLEAARHNEIDALRTGTIKPAAGLSANEEMHQLFHRTGPAWDGMVARRTAFFDKGMAAVQSNLLAVEAATYTHDRKRAHFGFKQVLTVLHGRAPEYRDEQGLTHNSDGTSWSAPALGGSLGGVLQRFPQLSDEDAVVAALVTARKVTGSHGPEGSAVYAHNARGLSFSDNGAGFGLFDARRFAGMLQSMADMQAADPQAATQRVAVTPRRGAGSLRAGIPFRIAEDGTALRGMVAFSVPGDALKDVPLTLIAPDGTRSTVIPARGPQDDGTDLLTVSTSAMLGSQTRGTWRIQAPEDVRVQATLRLVAVQENSIADRAIAAVTQAGPQPLHERGGDIVRAAKAAWSAPATAAATRSR